MVDPDEWNLSGMMEKDRDRAARLLDPPSGEELIATVGAEAMEAAMEGRSSWGWQEGHVVAGCGRAIGWFPLCRDTFDALFNGRSGYRAQYYLSCHEGVDFNATLLSILLKPLRIACTNAPGNWPGFLQHSFEGPHSKIWVFGDGGPFCDAPRDQFAPKRWATESPASLALRAPLPDSPAIEVKGTWVSQSDQQYRQDEMKADRHCTLSRTGFV